jgi:hypothetical protein
MYNFLVSKHLSFPKEDLLEKLLNNLGCKICQRFSVQNLKEWDISGKGILIYLSCHRKWSEFGIQGLLGPKKVVPEKKQLFKFQFFKKVYTLKMVLSII